MRIVAALCWFDEPLEALDRCVRSLAGIADAVVALDGRWEHMDGPDRSPVEQEDIIGLAADDVDLGHTVVVPRVLPWGSQPEKRTELMQLCFALAADWILVIDGDEHVQSARPAALREMLEHTTLDAASVTLNQHLAHSGELMTRHPRRLLRASSSLEYTFAHNAVRNDAGFLIRPVGDERETLDALDATDLLAIYNDRGGRPDERARRARRYYQRRAELKLEAVSS